ncbi:choice-of-anchor C family protein [Kribbella sp. NPDC051770]|uniref:choice-of-anchor C family protein n=1 Tax=Kribbella sp. NPDC051770 TaxID=3155413 RepID=UPI0034161D9F
MKFRRTSFLLALSTALVALTASPASAASIVASGFETPRLTVEFKGFGPGQQLDGWTVTSGGVDLTTDWQDAEGRQSLDLNGSSPGAIARTFATQLLTTYKVTYALAGNTEGPPALKSGRVAVNGQELDTFTFDIAGKSNANMGWTYRTFYFTNLLDSTATLEFASTSLQAWGPVIDDVKVDSCLLVLCPASASQVNRIS